MICVWLITGTKNNSLSYFVVGDHSVQAVIANNQKGNEFNA